MSLDSIIEEITQSEQDKLELFGEPLDEMNVLPEPWEATYDAVESFTLFM